MTIDIFKLDFPYNMFSILGKDSEKKGIFIRNEVFGDYRHIDGNRVYNEHM